MSTWSRACLSMPFFELPPNERATGLAAHVLLEIPALGGLADEEDKAAYLGVPVLGRPIFREGQLAHLGLVQLWHFVGLF